MLKIVQFLVIFIVTITVLVSKVSKILSMLKDIRPFIIVNMIKLSE